MGRQDAAPVFKIKKARPDDRGLDLRSVMEGGIPVAERCVKTSGPQRGSVAEGVAELQALEIGRQAALRVIFKNKFDDGFDPVAKLRGQIETQGAEGEAALAVGWVLRIRLHIADVGKAAQGHAQILAFGRVFGNLNDRLFQLVDALPLGDDFFCAGILHRQRRLAAFHLAQAG